ncbi:MAG TPA: NAD(P)/FAD-dependent oxidoreductase [Ignavibacteria bacterium]|nr:NAD(P)/FAD-dependent oxidoreductase [Ignavibacteria bacterium]
MIATKHFNVLIIGAGPAGIGAAIALSKRGIKSIAIIERNDKLGGIPSFYKKKKGGIRTFVRWSRGGIPVFGEDYAKWLEKQLVKTKVQIELQSQVCNIDAKKKILTLVNNEKREVNYSADAIIMACGSREETPAERGWLAGSRPVRVLFTKQLLRLLDGNHLLPMNNPLIIGSDIIGYAVAAKLKAAGASDAIIVDNCSKPKCGFFERLYFRMWSNPNYKGLSAKSIEVIGNKTVTGVMFNGENITCDGIVVCGVLIPNSELALNGNIKVELHSRQLVVVKDYQLSESGWFATGNMLGGFHGAEWCYFNGRRVARTVTNYLSNKPMNLEFKNEKR